MILMTLSLPTWLGHWETENIYANLTTIEQYYSVKLYFYIIYSLLQQTLHKKIRLLEKLKKDNCLYITTVLCRGLGSWFQERTWCTVMRRLGKGFALPFRHWLYSGQFSKLLRMAKGPVWSMDSSHSPCCGLLPACKCLAEEEGHASLGRQTVLSGRIRQVWNFFI